MRQIESESQLAARSKRRQIILGVVMIVILLGSTIGYALSLISSDSTGTDLTEPYFDGNSWIVPYAGYQFSLQTSPGEAAKVPIEGSFSLGDYQGQVVYIDSESESIKQTLGGVLSLNAQRVQEACYGACERPNVPERDCSSPLIVWKGSENRRIYTNASCVFIEGDYVSSDAFLYRLLGYI